MIDSVRPIALKRRVGIELIDSFENNLFLMGDKQRIKQILLNLINNAIKYNNPDGHVTIRCQVMTESPGKVKNIRITISDTGLGIAPENIGKLFSPFERIGAEQTETEGSGLGLVVVKKLLDAMGGKIGIDSTLNEGSSFWFELPQAHSIMNKNGPIEPENANLLNNDYKQGTILYVEDNTSNIELLEQILKNYRSKISMITDTNGGCALKLAAEYQPLLILLDLNLPEMHGSEILKQLKSDERTRSIPVVVISADAMPKQKERLMEGGAKEYLTKPLDIVEFLKILDFYTLN